MIYFVPLIVKLKVFSVPDYVLKYYPVGKTFDFFTYYKAMLLVIGATVLLPMVVYYRYKIGNKIRFDLVAKVHLLFGVSILMSTIMSGYKEVAFFGFFNKNEGALTWWAYLFLSYAIYLFVESREEVVKFVKIIIASTTTISVIGLFQYIGMDYIKFDWVQKIIYGPYYQQMKQSGVTMIFPDRTIYSTVANPNYMGSVMALAIPLILYLMVESKNKQEKLIWSGLLVLHLFILAASKSTAGLIGASIALIGYGVYKLIKQNFYKVLILGATGLMLILGVLTYSGLIDTQIGKVRSLFDLNQTTVNPFKEIAVDGTRLKFTDQTGNCIVINHNEATLWVENQNGNILSAKIDENGMLYTDKKWSVYYHNNAHLLSVNIHISETNKDYVRQVYLTAYGYTLYGDNLDNGKLNSKKINLFKNESLFTDRGYIWNRAIPIIINKPILGYGADSFVLEFPQNDLLDKPIYNQITDKPHNLFLQLGFNFGILGLGIFIFMIYAAVKSSRNIELILSAVAYVIAGMANDSTVFTSILFFSVLGLLYSRQSEEVT